MATQSTVINFPVPPVTPPLLATTYNDKTANGVVLTPEQANPTIVDITDQVAPPVVVKVSGPMIVQTGQKAQYAAQVTGVQNTAVLWSCSDGSIDQNGNFTAPAKTENVTVLAKSVASPASSGSLPVAIVQPSGRTQIFPSGGNDSAAFLAAAAKGPIQMSINPTNGSATFNFGPSTTLSFVVDILIDDNVINSDMKGYSQFVPMWLAGKGCSGKITGSGGPKAGLFTMPNCYNANLNGASQYNHGLMVNGVDTLTIIGLRFFQCGGDGIYVENSNVVQILNVNSQTNIRNPISWTNSINNMVCQGCVLGFCHDSSSGIAATDVEPNPTGAAGPCVITFTNCQFLDDTGTPISDGLRLSLNNLNPSAKVFIVVNGCTAKGNANADFKIVYPTGFSAGNRPPGWSITGSGNVDSNGPTPFPVGF